MAIRYACGVIGAMLVWSATALATPPPQVTEQDETPIALVGCLQKESDYRRLHDTGEGGFLGMGGGLGDEYILVNAFHLGTPEASAITPGFCRPGPGGEDYELTGKREDDLAGREGRYVVISGIQKEADVVPVGTTGKVRPEGGADILGRDLKLFEVSMTSFREPDAPVPAAAPAPQPIEPAIEAPAPVLEPAPQPAFVPEPQPVREELPKTASPLGLIGLLGLLSLGGAFGLRVGRR